MRLVNLPYWGVSLHGSLSRVKGRWSIDLNPAGKLSETRNQRQMDSGRHELGAAGQSAIPCPLLMVARGQRHPR